jgi:hypothetical protein
MKGFRDILRYPLRLLKGVIWSKTTREIVIITNSDLSADDSVVSHVQEYETSIYALRKYESPVG